MLEMIFLIVAFIGSILAAISDLKTTEIPDEIPYAMMGVGVVGHLIKSYLAWSYWPVALSLIVGLGFLGFGFLMYYTGQWGGGDAKVLSGIGFLLPSLSSHFTEGLFFPFPLSYFFNVFLIGAMYMLLYAVVLSLINRKILSGFVIDLKASSKMILLFNGLLIVFLAILGMFLSKYSEIFSVIGMIRFGFFLCLGSIGFYLLWRFAKTVENVGFKKKIRVSELREGDVLLDSKVWEGITKEQVKKIKKSEKKYVWVKEGVRFAPAFPLALAFTLVVGDGIVWLIGLI